MASVTVTQTALCPGLVMDSAHNADFVTSVHTVLLRSVGGGGGANIIVTRTQSLLVLYTLLLCIKLLVISICITTSRPYLAGTGCI